MSVLVGALTHLYRIAVLLTSWLLGGLQYFASLLEPERPPSELPVTASPSILPCVAPEVIPMLTGERGVTRNEQSQSGPPTDFNVFLRMFNSRKQTHKYQLNKMTHAEKRKPHGVSDEALLSPSLYTKAKDEAFRRGSSEVWETISMSSPCASPTQSIHYTPFLPDSSVFAPLTSSVVSCSSQLLSSEHDPTHRYNKRLSTAQKFEAEIGGLGKRRGFKGAPLLTQATRRSTSFLSLSYFSPRNPSITPVSSRPSTPRTSLSTVTNIIKGVSTPTKPVHLAKEISPDLQDFYDQANPFATWADTFFTPEFCFGIVPIANLDNFGLYHAHENSLGRTQSLKRKPHFGDLRAAPIPNPKTVLKTTIYDISAPALPLGPKSMSVNGKEEKYIGNLVYESYTSPKIVLTVPSAPSSPTKPDAFAGSVRELGLNVSNQSDLLLDSLPYEDLALAALGTELSCSTYDEDERGDCTTSRTNRHSVTCPIHETMEKNVRDGTRFMDMVEDTEANEIRYSPVSNEFPRVLSTRSNPLTRSILSSDDSGISVACAPTYDSSVDIGTFDFTQMWEPYSLKELFGTMKEGSLDLSLYPDDVDFSYDDRNTLELPAPMDNLNSEAQLGPSFSPDRTLVSDSEAPLPIVMTRGTCLRPLMLPMRLASRSPAEISSSNLIGDYVAWEPALSDGDPPSMADPTRSSMLADKDCKSRRLDEIIVLLEMCKFEVDDESLGTLI